MDWVTLMRKAEPSASSAAMAGCEWMPVVSALEAALSARRVGHGRPARRRRRSRWP